MGEGKEAVRPVDPRYWLGSQCGRKRWSLIGKRQAKLEDFIDKHLGGNMAEFGRMCGMKQPQIWSLVTKGRYGDVTAEKIMLGVWKIDPKLKMSDILIAPDVKVIQRKKRKKKVKIVRHADPIPPSLGFTKSVGVSAFSRAYHKIRYET